MEQLPPKSMIFYRNYLVPNCFVYVFCFRAWIPAKNIFDLSYKPPQKKKSKIWNQAIFELNEHVRILKERKLEVNGIKVRNLFLYFICKVI